MTDMKKIIDTLNNAKKVLVLCHVHPDPDAIGSAGAVVATMKALGKEAYAFSAEDIPDALNTYNIAQHFSDHWDEKFKPDAIVITDTAETHMIEEIAQEHLKAMKDIPLINIDHHPTNAKFGTMNFIGTIPTYSSASEIFYCFIKEAGWPLDEKIASYVLLGILGDTMRFSHFGGANTLRSTAELVDAGADLYKINLRMENRMSMDHIQYWAETSLKLQRMKKGQVMWSIVPMKILDKYPDGSSIKSDMMNFWLYVKECSMTVVFSEHHHSEIQVSFRSTDKANCLPICEHFGGGGHERAAGCRVEGSLDDVRKKVLAYIEEHFEDQLLKN